MEIATEILLNTGLTKGSYLTPLVIMFFLSHCSFFFCFFVFFKVPNCLRFFPISHLHFRLEFKGVPNSPHCDQSMDKIAWKPHVSFMQPPPLSTSVLWWCFISTLNHKGTVVVENTFQGVQLEALLGTTHANQERMSLCLVHKFTLFSWLIKQ